MSQVYDPHYQSTVYRRFRLLLTLAYRQRSPDLLLLEVVIAVLSPTRVAIVGFLHMFSKKIPNLFQMVLKILS